MISKLFLTIVPLAALIAVVAPSPVRGGSFTAPTNDCGTAAPVGFCRIDLVAAHGGNPDFNWEAISVSPPGECGFCTGYLTPNATRGLQLNAGGFASGSVVAGETVPVSWDFTVNGTATQNLVDWNITFGIYDGSDNPLGYLSESGSAFVGSTVSGDDLIEFSAGNLARFAITFDVHNDNVSVPNNEYTVSIPAGATIDLNNVVSADPAPEPAAAFLAAGGIVFLLALSGPRFRFSPGHM